MFIFVLSLIMFELYNTDNFSDVPDEIIPSIRKINQRKWLARPPRVIKRNDSKRSVNVILKIRYLLWYETYHST